jgi:hypothetical protein
MLLTGHAVHDQRVRPHSPRRGLVQQIAAGNSRCAGQLTVYGNSNIMIAGYARFRRLCLS